MHSINANLILTQTLFTIVFITIVVIKFANIVVNIFYEREKHKFGQL